MAAPTHGEGKRVGTAVSTRAGAFSRSRLDRGAMSLPGSAYAAPRARASDKMTVACIGVGAQGLRVLLDLLRLDAVQIVAVCDVNRGSSDYLEWGTGELRGKVRKMLGGRDLRRELGGPDGRSRGRAGDCECVLREGEAAGERPIVEG